MNSFRVKPRELTHSFGVGLAGVIPITSGVCSIGQGGSQREHDAARGRERCGDWVGGSRGSKHHWCLPRIHPKSK